MDFICNDITEKKKHHVANKPLKKPSVVMLYNSQISINQHLLYHVGIRRGNEGSM